MKWIVKQGADVYVADVDMYSGRTFSKRQKDAIQFDSRESARLIAYQAGGCRVVRLVPKRSRISGTITLSVAVTDPDDIAHMAYAGKPGGEVWVTANGWRVGRVTDWSVTWG